MSEEAQALGRFPVVATAAEAEAFCRATGVAQGATLPITFPMRWLTSPEVRAALLALVESDGFVLVHEGQSFTYTQALRADEPYSLTLTARRQTAPDRLVIDGTIADEAGLERTRLETILRLIAAPAEVRP